MIAGERATDGDHHVDDVIGEQVWGKAERRNSQLGLKVGISSPVVENSSDAASQRSLHAEG